MDFLVGLPRLRQSHDIVCVVIDRLTKYVHSCQLDSHSIENLANVYVNEIVRLHIVAKSIVSNGDNKFTSRLLKKIKESLGTKLTFNTVFHH